MARVTVYVPDDLKARMDEAGKDVNWSALAQRAFIEAALTQAVRKDQSNMDKVVERLRASKERVQEADFEAGKTAGAQWAKQSAEYDELERLWKYAEDNQPEDEATLRRLIDPDENRDWRDFWELLGRENPSENYVIGFAEGAVEVFDEVAYKL
jgi:hypothetical protein